MERKTREIQSLDSLVEGEEISGKQKPKYRVVAGTRDKDGKERLVTIGAAWERVSKNKRKYLALNLGYLKLFPVE